MKKLMMQLPVKSPKEYPIFIENNFFTKINSFLPAACHNKKWVIITDDTIYQLHKNRIDELIAANRLSQPLLLTIAPGEHSKVQKEKTRLEEMMLAKQCHRDTVILALGGGVVGDLAGFIAATYMRGIPYVQIPTTLLAMVDSSIGGKTAINTPQGKNLIGAFYQPEAVIIDTQFLNSLPEKEFVCGLIEAFKLFMTCDAERFSFFDANIDHILSRDEKLLPELIATAVQIKRDVVTRDEKEIGERAILNFGHTIGHAVEKITDYQCLHGFAVGLGMLVDAKLSEKITGLSSHDYLQIKLILEKLNIHGHQFKNYNIDSLIAATLSDKKVINNDVHYVLLEKLGAVKKNNHLFTHTINHVSVIDAINEVRGE